MTNKEIQTTKSVALMAAMSAAALTEALQWVPAFTEKCSDDHGWGMVETYAELAEIAFADAEMLAELNAANADHRGVYHYEVLEPVGKAFQTLIMQGRYSKEEILLSLGSYAAEFFVYAENYSALMPIITQHTGYKP